MRLRGWLGVTTAISAISIAAIACGGLGDASSFGDSAPKAGADGGVTGDPFADASSPTTILEQDAVLLVHAANAPAFRLCFESAPDLKPMPDATLMPGANVVGVEVGSAVRINPVPSAAAGRGIWYFSEPIIRDIYGPSGQSSTCGELLGYGPTAALGQKLPGFSGNLDTGIHVLAVTGCAASTGTVKYTTAECGDDYEGDSTLAIKEVRINAMARQGTTSLPAQLIDLSKPLDIARSTNGLRIAYGDLAAPESTFTVLSTNPSFGVIDPPTGPVSLELPTQPADFDKKGFRVSIVDDADGGSSKVVDQSLSTINRLSAPNDVPTEYYRTASSYLFILLGSPAPAYADGGGVDPDELRNVHMLAVPVYVPDFDAGTAPDAGDDAGTKIDGAT